MYSGKPTGTEFASSQGFTQKDGGLLIPLHPLIGGDQRYQLRYLPGDEPNRRGKAQKFTTPRGQPNCLVTSPLTRDKVAAGQELIFICEGVTRVDALASYGIPAVGLLGVHAWRGTNSKGGLTALADWETVSIKGNRFVLAPDGDVQTNPLVLMATERLAGFLRGRGADNVMILALPPAQGLDDFIAARNGADVDTLLNEIKALCTQEVARPARIPKESPDGFFEKDDAEPWSLSPQGDAYRLLAHSPDKVMVVRPADPKGSWSIMVEVAGGRWSYRDVDKLLLDSALAWHHEVTHKALNCPDAMSRHSAEKATKHAVQAATPRGRAETLASIGAVYGSLEGREQLLPKGLTVCDEKDIDSDRFSIGTPDGVLSLKTGELLPPAEARKLKVTRSIPDSYDKDARHPLVDALMAHLDQAARKYITDALGWALRGNPSRRWYLLCGEAGGGKTSLFLAVHAAMGDVANSGYAVWFDIESLLTSRFSNPNGHQSGLVGMHNARFAFGEEPPPHRNFNEGLVKNITGGGAVAIRDLNERGQKKPVMATMFVGMNPVALPGLHLDSTALSVRTKLLVYPQLTVPPEKRDEDFQKRVVENKAIRQAIVAMLVDACRQLDNPPVDTPSIEAFLAERRDEAIGPVGVWLRSRLEVTNQHINVVNLDALWALLGEEFGEKDGDIEGRDRRATWSLCRELVSGLPIVKRTRRGSEWRGVRLLTEEEAEAHSNPRKCESPPSDARDEWKLSVAESVDDINWPVSLGEGRSTSFKELFAWRSALVDPPLVGTREGNYVSFDLHEDITNGTVHAYGEPGKEYLFMHFAKYALNAGETCDECKELKRLYNEPPPEQAAFLPDPRPSYPVADNHQGVLSDPAMRKRD